MNYVARRKIRLNGEQYEPGAIIPPARLPGTAKLGSLVRVGYLVASPEGGQGAAPVSPESSPLSSTTDEAPESAAAPLPALGDLKVPQLRKLCSKKGLDSKGKRAELIERLEAASAQ